MKDICIVLLAAAASTCALVRPACAVETIKEHDLYSFCSQHKCVDGGLPLGALIVVNGTIYGTTQAGGASGGGTVFALDPNTGTETVLHSFCGFKCADGESPFAGLISVDGTLYGTTVLGGTTHHGGTLFSLDPATGAETVLHSFEGKDGKDPEGNLIHVQGRLYGTTAGGGTNGYGTVFLLDLNTGREKVLHSFCSQCSDGSQPEAGLIDVKGTLYGTTYFGGGTSCDGIYGCGIVFSLERKTGAETVLYAFSGGTDGQGPLGDLINLNGTLYGTTISGGGGGNCDQGCGTIFSLGLSTGVEAVVHSFGSGTDGSEPEAGMINVNGTLYGTTHTGGAYGGGAVFAFDPATGAETVLYSFCSGTCDNGPHAGLTHVKGTMYGTTYQGGGKSAGTVFALKKF